MKKHLALLVPLSFASLLAGCPSAPPPPPPQAAQPTPASTPAEVPLQTPPALAVVAGSPPVVPGLIPPTNVAKQKEGVTIGRADPFAIIPVRPKIIPQKSSQAKPPGATASDKGANAPNQGAQGATPIPPPPGDLDRSAVPALPPSPPQPREADGVVVSGIIQLPTTAIAIVQAPGERTVRSVIPGARLSNGQVLVKAIYANPENPIVVLEQYGIEITKKIGEGAPVAEEPTTTS